MKDNTIKKNKTFYRLMGLFLLEGLLSGINFTMIFLIIRNIIDENFSMEKILYYFVGLALVYIIRNLSYRKAYTLGQFAGADISSDIRLGLGNKFKEIPLSNLQKLRLVDI